MGKHAYLIMAHHRPDLLSALLDAIDHPLNDVYVHIDKKNLELMRSEDFSMKSSSLYFIPSIRVNWGGYSQIRCEIALLKAALEQGPYDYFHLLTGSTYPLKSQEYIHRFFQEHQGREFVSYGEPRQIERVKYIFLYSEKGKTISKKQIKRREKFLVWQAKHHVDRFRRFNMEFKKGLAYWSITRELAEYTVKNKKLIRKMFRHSFCGDEVFVQTLAYNSIFREKLYDACENENGALRLSTWSLEDQKIARPGHNFLFLDINYLLNSKALFALKFEGEAGLWLIGHIRDHYGD